MGTAKMNTRLCTLATVLLCACSATAAHAAPGEKLSGCVELSPDHQATRFGSQYLVLRDNGAHYRLGFAGSCHALAVSSNVSISTDGQPNRLCPGGTEVSTKRDVCKVRAVDEIRADEFERYARRGRR